MLTLLAVTQSKGQQLVLPIDIAPVTKTRIVIDKTTQKAKRVSEVTKLALAQTMLDRAVRNQVHFKHVLFDRWFAANDLLKSIHKLEKSFVTPIKSNRLIALADKPSRRECTFKQANTMTFEEGRLTRIWLQGLECPLNLVRTVFRNKDGCVSGELLLVTNDLSLDAASVQKLYSTRWRIEEFHKSLKQHTCVARSPTQTLSTQSNHLCASVCASIKLETLKRKTVMNHFALKHLMMVRCAQSAFAQLKELGLPTFSHLVTQT